MDELVFVADLPAHGRKTFQVTLSSEKSTKTYPERVYADMFIVDNKKGKHQRVQAITVPGTSNIYSMVRPHGPVLESELVGYRLYFNEKQTPDIYGKFNKGLEIKESQFYPTDEHPYIRAQPTALPNRPSPPTRCTTENNSRYVW